MSKKILLTIAAFAASFTLFMIWYIYGEKTADPIDSFKDCKAAGYPIRETFPEQCATPDGKIFPNPDQSIKPS